MFNLTKTPQRHVGLLGDIDMDGLFNGLFLPVWEGAPGHAGRAFAPPLDIVETTDGFEVRADLPGVKKEDLSVSIKDNVLVIEAETREESVEQEGKAVIKSERRVGKYRRALRLGTAVDEAQVGATYHDGVLRLTLPRAAVEEGRKIDIAVH